MRKIALLALAAMGSASLFAQETSPVTFGAKVGIPITDMFSARNTTLFDNNIPGSNYTSSVPRYTFGASAEFHLPYGFRFEVDGLYKRGGFDSTSLFNGGPGLGYNRTSLNVWEIPGLFKYNFAMGHLRPFVDFGASLRHISTIASKGYPPGYASFTTLSDNSTALQNRNSFGGVAGVGMTFKKGMFELSPEVRYTRWANESFQTNGLKTNLDQGDVLLGISF